MDWEIEIRRVLDGQAPLTIEARRTSALGAIRNMVEALAREKLDHAHTQYALEEVKVARDEALAANAPLLQWQTLYGQLITNALPGVNFPAGYDFKAEHENDIARVRAQAQVDLTLERDDLKAQLEMVSRRVMLMAKAKAGRISDAELDELEGG